MQTYFTELPSPSLKHAAHKYTMKTFKNGKWKYFYDTITGRQKYKDTYDKAKKKYYSTMSNNILDNKTSEERIQKATRNTGKKLTEASIAGFDQGLRIYNANSRGENTNNLYSQANESAKLWDHEVKKARAKQYDEVRKAAGLKRSQESMMRAQDAKMAAAKRNYEMSVPERLSREIKKKTANAKQSVADAFKKAKNLVRVENVRKTSSNLMPAGYQKVETVPKKKKKSK